MASGECESDVQGGRSDHRSAEGSHASTTWHCASGSGRCRRPSTQPARQGGLRSAEGIERRKRDIGNEAEGRFGDPERYQALSEREDARPRLPDEC
jgi:hypothetical protein